VGCAIDRELHRGLAKIHANLSLDGFPHISESSKWVLTPDGAWTGGFWIGELWISFEETGDERYARHALRLMERLALRAEETVNHDLGMLFYPSFVRGWELTGDPSAREVAYRAAVSLAAQFNERAGLLPGWGFFGTDRWRGQALIDTLMNVPLLVWAEREFADRRCGDVARCHIGTSLRYHLRADGSTYQVIRFDPQSGDVLGGETYQGASSESCWARGQAWAITGLALLSRMLGDASLSAAGRRAADYFLGHLPADLVPHWDLLVSGQGTPRDSSAAAIAAYGLLQLGGNDSRYAQAGRAIIGSLCDTYVGPSSAPGILVHATADFPHGRGIDGCTVYGDYFFMRALCWLATNGATTQARQ
jgi:unsaturated chondroitin disaccharide hydrolase